MEASAILSLLLISASLFFTAAAALGINYGQIANNLPHPESVIPLVKSIGATRLKLYDADPRVLKAFANTSVEFNVGIGNEYLTGMRDPKQAQAWVKSNVQCFNDSTLSSNLLPSMENIHADLVSLNLDKRRR